MTHRIPTRLISLEKYDPDREFFPVTIEYREGNFDFEYTGLDSLKKVRLGAVKGYGYGEILDPYIEANAGTDAVQLASGDDPTGVNVAKLIEGEIDLLIEGQGVFDNYLVSRGLAELIDQFRVAGRGTDVYPAYFAFSPADPNAAKYAAILDEGIDAIRASGELQKILDKYYMKDWK